MHIARNYAGAVIFRADNEEEVKEMIDNAILEQERREKEKEEAKRKKEEAKVSKNKRGLFQAPQEEVVEEEKEEVEEEKEAEVESILTPPHQRITRGPDGKFISKSKLQEQGEEEKKKKLLGQTNILNLCYY